MRTSILDSMNPSSSQFVSSRRMGVYDPIHQITMWEENFESNGYLSASTSLIDEGNMKLDNQSKDASHGILGTPTKYDQEANKLTNKIQRRLAQNREAARKSRLRKKAYVQQLESCRLKLMQLEREVDHVRQQGLCIDGGLGSNNLGFAGSENSGITTFKMEYGEWIEEQNRQILELRSALSAHIDDIQLETLVDGIMNHYFKFFCMKSAAAKADVFYVMSGLWKTTTERLFLWIGGFRPSELLKILVPLCEPLTEEERLDACSLEKSCRQAEDALSQGMNKLQQMLAETVEAGQLVEGTYIPHMATVMERSEALVSFVNQADHLRQETLQQMSRILSIRQNARWLLTFGEYFQRLRALSKLWADHPTHE
ncbi:transcription factor TGA4-like isoform X2 [Gastrolobium bilobum]|uniref:transcription factor TGA4-like isoform X2 n=1 Tax=Gastrolobium bilobum TaxID=150636 RepID=UPI002AB05EC9|nr:transcription factor TGA4-like isoform X2 [Gastrolobium bilobum]